MRRFCVCTLMLLLCLVMSWWSSAVAGDDGKGPDEIILRSKIDALKVPKPALLPHRAHFDLNECSGCHHGKGADGKKKDYVEGQKIEKCETCHNSKVVMSEKVATLKRASHVQCMECHRQNDVELTKCGVCHKKTKL